MSAYSVIVEFFIKCINEIENARTTRLSVAGTSHVIACKATSPSSSSLTEAAWALSSQKFFNNKKRFFFISTMKRSKSCSLKDSTLVQPNANIMACEMKVALAFFIHPREPLDWCLCFFFRQPENSRKNSETFTLNFDSPNTQNSKWDWMMDWPAKVFAQRKNKIQLFFLRTRSWFANFEWNPSAVS